MSHAFHRKSRLHGNFQQIFMEGKMTEKKKNGGEVTHFCALCESRNANKRCGGCRVRWYCSKECQVLHWKRGGHKRECQALLQSAAERAQSTLIFPNVASELHLISFLVTHKNEVSQCDSNLSDRQIAEGPVLMN